MTQGAFQAKNTTETRGMVPHHPMSEGHSHPSRTIVHAKLEMTEPGDHDEQEADAIAETIAAGGKISRKISGGSGTSGINVSNQMESQLNHLRGGGQAMPTGLRNMMESGFGQDFSHVRLHTDSEAASLSSSIHAKAFTHGNDIYFNQGQFSPDTSEGQKLMAHELTHTIQNRGVIAREKNEDEERAARIAEEKRIRGELVDVLKDKGFQSMSVTISKNQDGGLILIDNILDDCESLIKQINPAEKIQEKMIVQQVYNTLTQVSSAMDILVNAKLINPDKDKDGNLSMTDWIETRDHFIDVVRNLAEKAHNPAIAVLMYEGTYYRSDYNSVLNGATKKAAGKGLSSGLSKYGAVCNNAAFGSLIASDTTYKFVSRKKPKDPRNDKSRISGLSSGDRRKWSDYDLKGSGYGKNALDSAQQGDAIIFWNLSERWIKDSLLDSFDEWLTEKDIKKVPEVGRTKKDRRNQLISQADSDGGAVLNDLINQKNVNASHIEIITGVRGSGSSKKFLLSGAHDSSKANGIARDDRGNLEWKNADSIRNKRMMRLFPIDRSSDFIEVNLSDMQYEQQTYKDVATDDEHKNPHLKSESSPRLVFENSLEQVTINWLSYLGGGGQTESFEQTLSDRQDVDATVNIDTGD